MQAPPRGARCWTDDGHLQRRPAAAPQQRARCSSAKGPGEASEAQPGLYRTPVGPAPAGQPGFPKRAATKESQRSNARPHTAYRIPHPASRSRLARLRPPGTGRSFFDSSRRVRRHQTRAIRQEVNEVGWLSSCSGFFRRPPGDCCPHGRSPPLPHPPSLAPPLKLRRWTPSVQQVRRAARAATPLPLPAKSRMPAPGLLSSRHGAGRFALLALLALLSASSSVWVCPLFVAGRWLRSE